MVDLLVAGRSFAEAQEQTDWLLQNRPHDPETHVAISNLLAAKGEFGDAVLEMQKALNLAPSRWDWQLNLALLQVKNNQPDLAEAIFKKAIALNPSATDAMLFLGVYYQVRGRFADAEREFRDAIAADAKNPAPYGFLARFLVSQGKMDEAER